MCAQLPAAASLEKELARRSRLQNNALYPPAVQVDCPCDDCLGLGYLGFDTVMCFICEHQWTEGAGAAAATGGEYLVDGVVVKRCPGCESPILKNGGCDHMICSSCKHEFFWTTLKPFRS